MAPRQEGSTERVSKFGSYWLLRRLGESGEGDLWLACSEQDISARSICALKRPLPHRLAEPDSIQRFLDEIRLTDLLSHPRISRVLDAGSVRGEPFLAMEYSEGKSLAHVLKALRSAGHTFPMPLAVYLAICICDALAYAHKLAGPGGRQLQLVHRNLNPYSLLIAYSGDINIIEFGMATSRLKEAQTIPGAQVPDTTYQSPEFLLGKAVDLRSDIYSLGVILWELCSGQSPAQTPAEQAVWLKSGRERFSSPSMFRKGVPQQLDFAIMRAVNNDPRERFASASDMGSVLKDLMTRLSPGWEKAAPNQMSQFMRSIFDSTWHAERHQLMRALQSVQKMAAQAEQSLEDENGDDDDEHTIAMISDEEMDDYDASDPFTDPGTAREALDNSPPVKSASRKNTRQTQETLEKIPGKGASGGAVRELAGIVAIAIGASIAAALFILFVLPHLTSN